MTFDTQVKSAPYTPMAQVQDLQELGMLQTWSHTRVIFVGFCFVELTNWRQSFNASVLLLKIKWLHNIVIEAVEPRAAGGWFHIKFDNIMTPFIINKSYWLKSWQFDSWKLNLKVAYYSSLLLLVIKISQSAREKLDSYCKIDVWRVTYLTTNLTG